MVATNLFNNALRVDLDEYLHRYRKAARHEHGGIGRASSGTGRRSWPARWPSSPARRTARGGRPRWRWPARGSDVAALDVARPLAYPGYALGSADDLETLAEECRALGVECLTFAADVRDDAAVTRRRERDRRRSSAASTSCSTTRASAATAWPTS